MKQEQAIIREHRAFGCGYRLLVFDCQPIAAAALPGQFVHLRVPGLDGSVLRRPFSIYRADGACLSILYKQVGKGTREMAALPVGQAVSLLGPLGNGFPMPTGQAVPVLVAGGYGVAPLCLLASRMATTGILFVGGRTAADILCIEDFERLGWDVCVATEDGSLGTKGRVTDALDPWLAERCRQAAPPPVFYCCGPDGLLRAIDVRAVKGGWLGWLSLDKHMGCGVGACLACVQRVRVKDGGSQWKRVCKEGPVFEAGEIFWDYGVKADNA